MCGGLHTLALTPQGQVYSWGCNDDGALGRSGEEQVPKLVSEGLKVGMSDIGAGDSHSIAYNKELGLIYLWGLYRNTLHGNVMDPIREPTRIGEFEFRRKKVQKVVCGAHHTLFLVGGHVSAVGDPENHNLGRLVLERHKRDKGAARIRIERVDRDRTKAIDVFAGSYHSFAVKEDGKLYAWGLNNYGQLGTGDYESTRAMKEVQGIDGTKVSLVVGGESHSAALLSTGEVFTWGRNDEGQLGYELPKPAPTTAPVVQPMNPVPASAPATSPAIPAATPTVPAAPAAPAAPIAPLSQAVPQVPEEKKVARNPEELAAAMGEGSTIPKDCCPVPHKVGTLAGIIKISAGTNFSYALDGAGQLYSWYDI